MQPQISPRPVCSHRLNVMVLLCWYLNGERRQEVVSIDQARHRHSELERLGAVVYWSERVAEAA